MIAASLKELSQALAARQVSSVELATLFLDRIAHFVRSVGGVDVGAVVPSVVDDVLQLMLSHDGCSVGDLKS